MKGSVSLSTLVPVTQAARMSRAFGPAIDAPAHWSVTEVSCTLRSGQITSSRYSRCCMTLPALAVVVVIRKSCSPSRQVVPSSSTSPSSRSISP